MFVSALWAGGPNNNNNNNLALLLLSLALDPKSLSEASIMGAGYPSVFSGGVQLLSGPTQYLTRQRLPMACVKLFLAVFVVPLLI